ncbi:hypothetical protein [Shewanella frigidimarina]|nr:hypothetical protein [Shewanella frigidimarina]
MKKRHSRQYDKHQKNKLDNKITMSMHDKVDIVQISGDIQKNMLTQR